MTKEGNSETESGGEVPWKQYGEVKRSKGKSRPKLRETEGAIFVFGAIGLILLISVLYLLGLRLTELKLSVFTISSTVACILTFVLLQIDVHISKVGNKEAKLTVINISLLVLLFITVRFLRGSIESERDGWFGEGSPSTIYEEFWLLGPVVMIAFAGMSILVLIIYISARQECLSGESQ